MKKQILIYAVMVIVSFLVGVFFTLRFAHPSNVEVEGVNYNYVDTVLDLSGDFACAIFIKE